MVIHAIFEIKLSNVSENEKILRKIDTFFYKQLGWGLNPQSCLYFQGLWGSKLLAVCLVVWPSNLYLGAIPEFSAFYIDIYDSRF